jgi:hypothetical protein
VEPHDTNPTRSLPQTRFPFLTLHDLIGLSGSSANRVLTARIENGMFEKGRAMDGRRESRRLPRITGCGPINTSIHPAGQLVELDKTSPVGPDGHP